MLDYWSAPRQRPFTIRLVHPDHVALYPLDGGHICLVQCGLVFFRQLGPMGLKQCSLQFIPELLSAGRRPQANWFEVRARQLVLLSTSTIAIIFGAIIYFFEISGLSGLSGPAYAVGLAAVPAYALVALMSAQFRARGRVRSGQWPDSILFPLLAMAAIQSAQFLNLPHYSGFWDLTPWQFGVRH